MFFSEQLLLQCPDPLARYVYVSKRESGQRLLKTRFWFVYLSICEIWDICEIKGNFIVKKYLPYNGILWVLVESIHNLQSFLSYLLFIRFCCFCLNTCHNAKWLIWLVANNLYLWKILKRFAHNNGQIIFITLVLSYWGMFRWRRRTR